MWIAGSREVDVGEAHAVAPAFDFCRIERDVESELGVGEARAARVFVAVGSTGSGRPGISAEPIY